MEYLLWNHNQFHKTFNTRLTGRVLLFLCSQNNHLMHFCRKKASDSFRTLSALVRLYQHVQQSVSVCLSLSVRTTKLSVFVRLFSVPSVLISNCLSLSVRSAQGVSLRKTFSVTSAQTGIRTSYLPLAGPTL